MQKALDKMTESLAHNVDPAGMRTIIPTLLFIRHTSRNGLLADNCTTWETLKRNPDSLELGPLMERAAVDIRKLNPTLADALPESLEHYRISIRETGLLLQIMEDMADQVPDMGDAYQYILHEFTPKSAKHQGQFFTPSSVADLMSRLIDPDAQSVYDPAAGAGTLLVHAHRRLTENEQNVNVYGQEINNLSVRLARMNAIIQQADADIRLGNTLSDDAFPELRADAVVANPPFNARYDDKSAAAIDQRWKFGPPPDNNANYAWLQHCLHHTAPDGTAVVLMPPGSLSSSNKREKHIRRRMLEDNHIQAIISLPTSLFMTTQVSAVIWVLGKPSKPRDQVMMIDASQMGRMIDRTRRELSPEDIQKVADTYNGWKHHPKQHEQRPGFARAASIAQMRNSDYKLGPGQHVDIAPTADEQPSFEVQMQKLAAEWKDLCQESEVLNKRIDQIFTNLGLAT